MRSISGDDASAQASRPSSGRRSKPVLPSFQPLTPVLEQHVLPTSFYGVMPDARGHGILTGEANYGEPPRGDFEKMARRRFQDPRPSRLGKWWYLLTWQDEFIGGRRLRKRKRIKLAPATLPEREV